MLLITVNHLIISMGHLYHGYVTSNQRVNFREYPHNSYGQKYGTFTYLHFVLENPIELAVG